ncbi:MAG: hypothetical protein J0L92_01700 [Deltaproteobacteria bacterium]|nr:hypothetical protein [Deltaproteobacteria bacterium]
MGQRGLASRVFLFATLLFAGPAHALVAVEEPPAAETASLGWSRGPGTEMCATAIQLGEEVEAILGRDVLVAAPDAELSLEGRIERAGEGFRAVIAVTRRDGSSEGERIYTHPGVNCRDATESIALILALLIDPDAEPPSDEPDPNATDPNATDDSPPAETRSEPVDDTVAPFGLAVDLSGLLAAFVTPSAAPGGRTAIHLRFPSGPLPPLAVVVTGWLAPWSRADASGGAWVDHLFVVGGAGLCTIPSLTDWLDLSICVMGEAGGGFVIAERTLVPDERERVLAFFEAAITLRAHVWQALTANLGASLVVPFRTEPWLATGNVYWRPDPVGLFVFLGVGFDVGFGR